MKYDKLIYGKDQTERVVSIEQHDDYLEIFIEDEQNQVKSEFVQNKWWLLSDKKIDSGFIRLNGNLHYKWGKQFNSKESFFKTKFRYKKQNFDIFSVSDPKEQAMINKGITYFKNMTPKDVSILSFDIEATGLFHNKDAKVLIISNTFRKGSNIINKLFCFDEYNSQGDLINAWCKWVKEINPSILCGHNIYSYDLPYLNYIAQQNDTILNIGRDNSALEFYNYESKFRVDGSRDLKYHKVRCYGREIVDTYFLSIKYDVVDKKFDSYGLKPIIKTLGLEKENRTFYDSSKIRENYMIPEEWEKIKEYCRDDAQDSLTLFDLMIPSIFYFTQSVPKSFQSMIESASGSQLNSILLRSYLQDKHSLPKESINNSFPGAISYGNPGIYRNCVKWDVSSLYPSIILQYEVYDSQKDPNKNFLKVMKYFTEQRLNDKQLYKKTKNKYYKDLEQSRKICINSGYGMLGAPGLLFNSPTKADFITSKGREILKQAIKWSTSKDFEYAS